MELTRITRLTGMVAAIAIAAAMSLTGTSTAAPATSEPVAGHSIRAGHDDSPVTVQTPADCAYYLVLVGYPLTPDRVSSCNLAAGSVFGKVLCVFGLIETGVVQYYAEVACRLS